MHEARDKNFETSVYSTSIYHILELMVRASGKADKIWSAVDVFQAIGFM